MPDRTIHKSIISIPRRAIRFSSKATSCGDGIAFLKAQLGKDGYSLSNFSEKNWYYDRVMEKNNFFAEQYFYSTNAFIMKPYHVLWPVPLTAITSNTQGRINQNIGYFGAEDNIPVE